MVKINRNGNAPMNTLKPQPGQSNSYDPKFHPLPGDWARDQLNGGVHFKESTEKSGRHHSSEIQKALAAEEAQHRYWEEWQGVTPGKAVYENPRETQNTLLPTAKYGTEGRGYG
jgi:hypothetical protein